MYAVTMTGTTVKRFQNDAKSLISGNNLATEMLPFSNFTTAIPTVITTNTTARITDIADVYFSESEEKKKKSQ